MCSTNNFMLATEYGNEEFNKLANNFDQRAALAELESKLFGIHRPALQEQRITDRNFIPIKTGIPAHKFLKNGPNHIMDAVLEEPLYPP